jgi:hypothetical protein
MNDRRIYVPGVPDECENDCGSRCGGGCGGGAIPIVGSDNDVDVLFRPGDFVKSKLTKDKLMVLKVEPDSPVTYIVRTNTYQMAQMFEFELEALDEQAS